MEMRHSRGEHLNASPAGGKDRGRQEVKVSASEASRETFSHRRRHLRPVMVSLPIDSPLPPDHREW